MNLDSSCFAEWIAKARQGDQSARNRLFATCRSFVGVMAQLQLNRRLHAKVDPSDLVQQSLLEAHQGFDQFQGATPAEWLAWLKQIVRHNAIDADGHYRQTECRDLRKEQSFTFNDSADSQHQWHFTSPDPSPSQNLAKVEREMQMAAAIEALPADYRQVILLRNLERLSFEDIAKRMNRTRGACQMLWMRAIEQLRTELNSLEHG